MTSAHWSSPHKGRTVYKRVVAIVRAFWAIYHYFHLIYIYPNICDVNKLNKKDATAKNITVCYAMSDTYWDLTETALEWIKRATRESGVRNSLFKRLSMLLQRRRAERIPSMCVWKYNLLKWEKEMRPQAKWNLI